MASSPQRPTLLHLPAEIRNNIYRYALSGEVFDVHCWRRYTPFGFATRVVKKRKNFLALLAVCHQIRSETHLFPFQFNAFRFTSQDAFKPWLDTFPVKQRESIREIHVVTWMARHMLEGEGWKSNPLDDVLLVQDLPGLRRVEVEVRLTGKVIHCAKEFCFDCGEHGDEVRVQEQKIRKWLESCNEELIVEFRRVMT